MTLDVGRAISIDGWMSTGELEWLYETAKTMERIVEIGSWCGRSTFALCSGCPGIVYAIDHFRGSLEHGDRAEKENVIKQFRDNTKHFDNLLTIVGDSVFAAKHLHFECDMLFIDGAHDYEAVVADLRAWRFRVGRLVAGHDWNENGVAKAVQDTCEDWDIEHGPGSIWYAKLGG